MVLMLLLFFCFMSNWNLETFLINTVPVVLANIVNHNINSMVCWSTILPTKKYLSPQTIEHKQDHLCYLKLCLSYAYRMAGYFSGCKI